MSRHVMVAAFLIYRTGLTMLPSWTKVQVCEGSGHRFKKALGSSAERRGLEEVYHQRHYDSDDAKRQRYNSL